MCGEVSGDELCGRCEARWEAERERDEQRGYSLRRNLTPSNVRIPYDPETDPF
jgi:hypothetical protein